MDFSTSGIIVQDGAASLRIAKSSWLLDYFKSLCWQNFTASAAKRVAITSTEYVLVRMFVPSALTSSVIYLTTSTAGTVGKNMVSYALNRSTSGDGTVMVAIPKESLAELEETLQQDKKWQFTWSSIPSQIQSSIKHRAIQTSHMVLNVTYQDLSEGTGALLGSTLASAAFVAYMGPPSLFMIPLYFLAEGCTKSIGAFLGKCYGRYYLGPKVFKPAIKGTWDALMSNQKALALSKIDEVYELVKIEIESDDDSVDACSDLLKSWYLFKERQTPDDASPKITHSDKAIVIIEDYLPQSSSDAETKETTQTCDDASHCVKKNF